ncbi:hypothetical protein G6F68_020474 [Rhizopus microsporus]|nr:hypothetical protein G6F68_020474 [Rhizopus microsporus]
MVGNPPENISIPPMYHMAIYIMVTLVTSEILKIKVWDVIGRSIVITEKEDDLHPSSTDGHSGDGLLCGIIARSAGAFENTKIVCACNGNTLWEEARLQEKQ